MTIRNRWDETRTLIEAGQDAPMTYLCDAAIVQQLGEPCPECGALPSELCKRFWRDTDWTDTKQAQHDGSRQIYGDAGKFMRGGEPG